jgi:hypothetical protein
MTEKVSEYSKYVMRQVAEAAAEFEVTELVSGVRPMRFACRARAAERRRLADALPSAE